MAGACKAWRKEVCQELEKLTSVVDAISLPLSPSTNFCTLSMHEMRFKLGDLTHSASLLPKKEHEKTHSEYTLFFQCFTSFLSTMIPKLDKLGADLNLAVASSTRATTEQVFWELWECTVTGCNVFNTGSDVWIRLFTDQQPLFTGLCITVNEAMLWLLPMTRSPAWMLMLPHNGLECRNKDLLVFLNVPCKCVAKLCSMACTSTISMFSLLPSSFLPLLCCIFSEQFASDGQIIYPYVAALAPAAYLSATTYKQGTSNLQADVVPLKSQVVLYLEALLMNISELACVKVSTEGDGPFPFLTTPAVVQFFRSCVVLSFKSYPKDMHILRQSLDGLQFILLNNKDYMQAVNVKSNSAIGSDIDAAGLPLYLHPFLSNEALDSDISFLKTLGTHVSSWHGMFSTKCFRLQGLVLEDWVRAAKEHPPSLSARAKMVPCLAMLADQCSGYGTQFICKIEKGKRRITWPPMMQNIVGHLSVHLAKHIKSWIPPEHHSPRNQFIYFALQGTWNDWGEQAIIDGKHAVWRLGRLTSLLQRQIAT